MKKIYFLGLMSLWGITLAGQVTLNWQVTDEQNRPLVGVNVWRQQTTDGAVTDENGRFTMVVNPGLDVLELSYLGYESVIMKTQAGMKLDGNEMMFSSTYDLPEVAIIAYGTILVRHGCCCLWSTIQEMKGVDSLSFSMYSAPKIRVYPIPTVSTIFLQEETPLGQIDLYNLNGQKLKSFNFSDQLNASIDLSAWPAGTYFLRSSTGWVEKVILQKQ